MHTIEAPRKRRHRAAPYSPGAEVIRPAHLPLVTGLSEVSIWRLRRKGEFPSPVRLGAAAIGWRREDIDRWLADRSLVDLS